jgi:hypothetical protein
VLACLKMMNKHTLFMLIVTITCSGCAQTISDESAKFYAAQISDACKEHALGATDRGYKFIPTYSRCIDNALIYLENKRKIREEKENPTGKRKINFYNIAKNFTKNKAKDAVKTKIKSI